MLPSENLREIISQKININLNRYAWNKDFKEFIFKMTLNEDYEKDVHYLKEVFTYGLNIGHCGLTARYIVMHIPSAELYYGKFLPLAGTKNSPNGTHVWIVFENYVIDTSLMLILTTEEAKELGYIFEKKISPSSIKHLSEYELFSNELKNYQKDKENFIKGLVLTPSNN